MNDKQVLEQQLEEEVQCLSDAEQRLEAALQKLAPKKEEHDALANKFKVLVQSEQEVYLRVAVLKLMACRVGGECPEQSACPTCV